MSSPTVGRAITRALVIALPWSSGTVQLTVVSEAKTASGASGTSKSVSPPSTIWNPRPVRVVRAVVGRPVEYNAGRESIVRSAVVVPAPVSGSTF